MTTARFAEPATANKSILRVDFDSGINTSTVWTEHVATASEQRGHIQEASLSDEEPENASNVASTTTMVDVSKDESQIDQVGLPARTLFDFDGKPEFGELTVQAGLDLIVLKSDVGDGWSLVDSAGRVGLIPTSYYAVRDPFASVNSFHSASLKANF